VGIDVNLDYGSNLTESKHVLLVIDENYVKRVNNKPNSGVGKENKWIKNVINEKYDNWLATIFVDNIKCKFPDWLNAIDMNPKSFNFNYINDDSYPGSEQIEDIWRWIQGLPADKSNAISPAIIRNRLQRVEQVINKADIAHWTCHKIEAKGIIFNYNEAPNKTYTLGYGIYEFKFMITSCDKDRIYVYNDYIKAVGTFPDNLQLENIEPDNAFSYIRQGRTIELKIGQNAVLLNEYGCICLVRLTNIKEEKNDIKFVPASVSFDYRICTEENTQTTPST
jgi:hypothetical protein